MKLKKVLTGSALSLALLVSAAPAFAANPDGTHSEQTSIASSDFKANIYTKTETNDTGIFINSYTDADGITWYLKKITKNNNGTWTAYYEGRKY
ncbi:hypothetical protein A4A36_10660 [Bacillus subtilis]|uniref:LCI fold-containing protein n=1 Tax=Bacillus stercoris TaxID=2054641 RepID=UPI0008FB8029|nr:hypothetical protein A4A37_21280 [Bacillus subtilis]OIS71199.1 hypothetical protein A4A35_05365 [Bacillus subtilis]OIS71796.1 hypothetical protein A4A36_10660 [Bacillus subtilis]